MRFLITTLSILFLIAGCRKDPLPRPVVCAPVTDLPVVADHPKADALQALMDEYSALGIPGMQILISDDDGIWMGVAGMADLEQRQPMEICHLNKLGSVTKMMMGTLVWQSIQAGKLAIDDPISAHIPATAAGITNGESITVGMLLNHTSGIYDISRDLGFNLAVVNDFTRSWTAESILEYVEGKPAVHAPGESVAYSNTNTLLLGMILEAVEEIPHSQLLQERLFQPLGMERTVYYDYATDFPRSDVARGYLDFHNDGGSIEDISTMNPGSGTGYTGVYATVGDLYRFLHALLREQILTSPDNLDFIFDSFVSREEGSWEPSYGAIHREYMDVLPPEIAAYGHAGGDIGFSATLNYFPHNNTILAATYNYGTNLPSPLGDVLDELRDSLILLAAEE